MGTKSRLILFWLAPLTAGFAIQLILQLAIGAPLTYTVTNLGDESVGIGHHGDLRYCISQANITPGKGVVMFLPRLVGQIPLKSPLPRLTDDIDVRGPAANVLSVYGGGGSVFSVSSGVTVALSGLTIAGGHGNGGGIFNQGILTLYRVTVKDNAAGDATNGGGTGAGIWNYLNGTLILKNSTVSGNSVIGNLSYNPSQGGGIANYGNLTLYNATVSGNSANQGFGGGIYNIGVLQMDNSTITNNSITGGGGGGIYNGAKFTASNTIIAGNTGSDLYGVLTSQGHNLIGNSNGGSGYLPSDLLDINPQLGPLRNNGGTTATHALLSGSPAIDAGKPQWDQRGPHFLRIFNGVIDIGSFEAQ